jgi:hypothetical protein
MKTLVVLRQMKDIRLNIPHIIQSTKAKLQMVVIIIREGGNVGLMGTGQCALSGNQTLSYSYYGYNLAFDAIMDMVRCFSTKRDTLFVIVTNEENENVFRKIASTVGGSQ